jgi:2-oxoglutarate decarboxylase
VVTTPPDSSSSRSNKGSFGPNAWLVDDMYDRFLADPNSVADSWREFFADYQRSTVPAVATGVTAAPTKPAVCH